MTVSGDRSEDDEWSDTEVLLVVRDAEYDRIHDEIKEILYSICINVFLLDEDET